MIDSTTVDPAMDPENARAKAEAQKAVSDLELKTSDLESKKGIDTDEITNMRKKLITDIFDLLVEVGVDPKDPAAVNDFLAQLEERDPDLLEIFLRAFENLSAAGIEVPTGVEGAAPAAITTEGGMPGGMPGMPGGTETPGMPGGVMPPDMGATLGGGQAPAGPTPNPEMGGAAPAMPAEEPMGSPKKRFTNIKEAMGMK